MRVTRGSSSERSDGGFTLIELTVVCALLVVVLVVVGQFFVASNRAAATASAQLGDTADARTAVERLSGTIEFATSLSIDPTGTRLYALQADGTTCDAWYLSGTDLMLRVGTGTAAPVITDVKAGSLAVASYPDYPGMVGVHFTVQQNSAMDAGSSVSNTFLATNATGPVQTKSGC